MLFQNLHSDLSQSVGWQDLEFGAPTIIGFALLCSRALSSTESRPDASILNELSNEAKTILVLAANRGTIDVRASRESFDSAERFLAICVEYELDQRILFLQKSDPHQTIKFLEGFRELCLAGLIMHHLQKDFSLSAAGFEMAKTLKRENYESLIQFGVETEH